MANYRYPAVFTKEGEMYSVCFLDFKNCVSCGCSIEEAREMARDALGLFLYDMEQEGLPLPAPSPVDGFEAGHVFLVEADTDEYQEKYCRCKKCRMKK